MHPLQLENEVKAFLRQLFNIDPDVELVTLYQQANEKILSNIPAEQFEIQSRLIEKALKLDMDIEALEYAWRLIERDNILTRKMHILIYLMETEPMNYKMFVNHRNRFQHAYASLIYYSMRSVLKLCKGFCILLVLKKYGIRNV